MLHARRPKVPSLSPRCRPHAHLVRYNHLRAKVIRPRLSVLPPELQPTIPTEDGARTLRLRQHGNRSLPLPPFMDPLVVEAKQRFKQPKKPSKDAEMSESQAELHRELLENPYAQALLTPIRQCNVTKARLPTHFLQPFSVQYASPSTTATTPKSKASLIPHPAQHRKSHTRPTGASTYVLAHQPLLTYLSTGKHWTSVINAAIMKEYGKVSGKKRWKAGEEFAWNVGIAEEVWGALRAGVVMELETCCKREGLIVPFAEVENASEAVMAVLENGGAPVRPDHEQYHPDATVYRLAELFGDLIPTVLFAEPLKGHERLAIVKDERNIRLLLALDKLKMYLKYRNVR